MDARIEPRETRGRPPATPTRAVWIALLAASVALNVALVAALAMRPRPAAAPAALSHDDFRKDLDAVYGLMNAQGRKNIEVLDYARNAEGWTGFLVTTTDKDGPAVLFARDGAADPTYYPAHWFRWMVVRNPKSLALMLLTPGDDPRDYDVIDAEVVGAGELQFALDDRRRHRRVDADTKQYTLDRWRER